MMPRMSRFFQLAVAVGLVIWTAAVCAQGSEAMPTGLDLVKRCHALNSSATENSDAEGDTEADPEMVEDYGYCLGYLAGFVSGFAARAVGGEGSQFCPPDDARFSDFVDAIQGWLVQHPEGLNQLGAYVAAAAFKSRFPCGSR